MKTRALKNQASGASRTIVSTVKESPTVAGFYSLAASSVRLEQAPGSIKRNMPEPIPAVLLGRLAVDRLHQGRGLGVSLLKDALLRVLLANEAVAVRTVLVHALDETAAAFYRRFGFVTSPLDPHILFLRIDLAQQALRQATQRPAWLPATRPHAVIIETG
ncbi:MAG: GNAT family N-acetyltransferase [Bifidobacteriaceae bacterium]|nr:GNAT family N-acetyltransferase [Bifidobacteriaceae bacterium]